MAIGKHIRDEAILFNVRFEKVLAERFPDMDNQGGRLDTTVNVSLVGAQKPEHAIAKLEVNVRGIPNIERLSEASFEITVVVLGTYKWADAASRIDLETEGAAEILCEPIYSIAALEIRTLATKLGYEGVRLPLDLRTHINGAKEAENKQQEPASSTPKKAKPSAPRKSKAK